MNLNTLPIIQKSFWYLSAGDDFRGPVFFSQHHLEQGGRHHGKIFSKPDVFMYNCLGNEIKELRRD
jgi:hypothetical protein